MQGAVRSHAELRILGRPTFLFSFTSDEFDMYHVNDFMRLRGWRLNGQQYPNALHMAVTRPQTQPGVADAFATDLADAVDYAKRARTTRRPQSGAMYGGVMGGMTDEADAFIRTVMADMHGRLPADARRGVSPAAGAADAPERASSSPSTSAPAARRSGWCRSPAWCWASTWRSGPGCSPAAAPSRTPRSGGR